MPPTTKAARTARSGKSSLRRNTRSFQAALRPPVMRSPTSSPLAVVDAEDRVLGEVEVEHQTAPLAVLRDVGDPPLLALARRKTGDLHPDELDPPADPLLRHQPGERLDELGLAVALDPGDAHDL